MIAILAKHEGYNDQWSIHFQFGEHLDRSSRRERFKSCHFENWIVGNCDGNICTHYNIIIRPGLNRIEQWIVISLWWKYCYTNPNEEVISIIHSTYKFLWRLPFRLRKRKHFMSSLFLSADVLRQSLDALLSHQESELAKRRNARVVHVRCTTLFRTTESESDVRESSGHAWDHRISYFNPPFRISSWGNSKINKTIEQTPERNSGIELEHLLNVWSDLPLVAGSRIETRDLVEFRDSPTTRRQVS
jgi:hypothetical protein